MIVMDTFADVREGCGNTPLQHYTGLFQELSLTAQSAFVSHVQLYNFTLPLIT